MNYTTTVLVVALIGIANLGMIIEDNKLYSGGNLPDVEVCDRQPLPDDLKEDQEILARLIMAEAGQESFMGQRAVADVVVHRSVYWGMSVREVIYDAGEFDGVYSIWFTVIPSDACYDAARLALLGKHVLPREIMFYHNPSTSTDRKWVSYISKFPYQIIGNHLFCYHPDFFDVEA